MKLTDDQIKHMVNRFLGWKLPKTFNPDGGVKFEPIINAGTTYEHRYEPSGTNIFSYSQAEEMVKFMLDGMPEPTPAQPEKLDVEALKKSDRRVDYPNGLSEQGVGRFLGWNDCIEHLSANYDFVRKA